MTEDGQRIKYCLMKERQEIVEDDDHPRSESYCYITETTEIIVGIIEFFNVM